MLSLLIDHTYPEILPKIVLYAFAHSSLGPPKELIAVSLTCRAAHEILSRNTGDFYLQLFPQKFDILTPVYRLGKSGVRDHAQLELRRRFEALRLFRSVENLDSPYLVDAFWIAYFMLEDSHTSQKNVKQLLQAGLPSFLDAFLRTRLYDGAAANNGWPLANEINSLTIALAWLLSSQYSVSRESEEDRHQLLNLLQPFVLAAFRYPISAGHDAIFDLSHAPASNIIATQTVHVPIPHNLPRHTKFPTSA